MRAPPAEIQEHLALVRVAKDLFLSNWYLESARRLFAPEQAAVFERISRESAEAKREALDLVQRWSAERTGDVAGASVARLTRREFVEALIEAKKASAEVFERAGDFAPDELREEFARLAAIDFRHAIELQEILRADLTPVTRDGPGDRPATPP